MTLSSLATGIALYKDGNIDAAREEALKALREDTKNADAWLLLSQTVRSVADRVYALDRVIELSDNAKLIQWASGIRSQLERMKDESDQVHSPSGAPPAEEATDRTILATASITARQSTTSKEFSLKPAITTAPRPRKAVEVSPRKTAETEPGSPVQVSRPRRRLLAGFNVHLWIGTLLVGVLIVIGISGPFVAPRDPMESFFIWQLEDGSFVTPPFAPLELPEFPLGTDFDGRDTLSRLLWAVRPTLVLAFSIAISRLLLGGILGIVEGWFANRAGGRIVSVLIQVAISIPVLIVAIILLRFVGLEGGIWPLVLALNVTGWASIARLVSERVRLTKRALFVEASRAMGGSETHIILRHVIPQLRTLLPILFSFEMGAALLQLAELGFLGFFFGGAAMRQVPDSQSPAFIMVPVAGRPELGQMLSAGWDNFFLAPWMAVWSGTAFTIAIFSFMVLGEGLRRYYARGATFSPLRRLAQAMVGQ